MNVTSNLSVGDHVIENMTSSSAAAAVVVTSSSLLPVFDLCDFSRSDDAGVLLSLRVFFFASVACVVVGLTGNAISVVVFSSKEMQTTSSNVYLLTLAASDSVYLVSVFASRTLATMRCWYFPSVPADVVNRSTAACVLLQYLCDLFSDYSACLILFFTVERAVAVFLPIKFKELFTVCRARTACLALLVMIGACIAPYHAVCIGIIDDYHVCSVRVEHEDVFSILYVVEMAMFRVVPVIVIAVLNIFIIVRVTRLTQAKWKRRKLSLAKAAAASSSVAVDQDGGHPHRGGSIAGTALHHHHHLTIKKKRSMRKHEQNVQLTIILILVSTSYVLLYIPALIHFVLYKLILSGFIDVDRTDFQIFGNYSRSLYVSGFAINFFLYTVSGRVFRDQLKALLCHRRPLNRQGTRTTPWTQTTTLPEASSAL